MLVRARIFALTIWLVGQAAAEDPLRATHDALFASFLPMEEAPAMFGEARDEIWSAAAQAPAFRSLITPFSDLRGFGLCGLTNLRTNAFDQLTPAERMRILFLLHACASNDVRRLVMTVRNFYLRKTYGVLQEPLTGVRLNLYAPDTFVKQHAPRLPSTRLRYDGKNHEIAHKDGVVEDLPGTMDDVKLKSAVDALLAKYPREPVALYLNAFNDMNEANWTNLKTMLESDARLQLGDHH